MFLNSLRSSGPTRLLQRQTCLYTRTKSPRWVPSQALFSSNAVIPNERATSSAIDAIDKPRATKGRKSAAKTSLRRAALEAQISQSHVQDPQRLSKEALAQAKTVTACCVAEQFDLSQVADILRGQNYKLDPRRTNLFPQVVHIEMPVISRDGPSPDGDNVLHRFGDVFIFPSGTLVAWDIPEDTLTHLASKTLRDAAVNPHTERLETENLDYFEDANRDISSIRGDTIILGTKEEDSQSTISPLPNGEEPARSVRSVLGKIAFSSGLARSTKLAVLESLLGDYFESTKSIPTMLSRGSGRGFTRSFVLQKTGQLLSIRAQLNLYSELTDSLPDLFWDFDNDLGLERSYDQIGRALDIGVRIKTLNEKMDYSQEISSVLRTQLSEQHSTRLEWIIIILIMIEVGFGIRHIWKERTEDSTQH